MKRRDFLKTSAAATLATGALSSPLNSQSPQEDESCCDRTYESPASAMKAPPETVAYVPAIYAGTATKKPDYLATVDLDPDSKTYSQIIHRLHMPNVGDELHHFGWNACSSCHGKDGAAGRRQIILPGISSGRIHIVDTVNDRAPKIQHVVAPEVIKQKTGLSAPHTVHCLASGEIMISMLGNSDGEAPGGFMTMDDQFNVTGRWENSLDGMNYNYDFWYQPRHNVMVSSEWAAPNTVSQGFDPATAAEKYGRHIHFWNWEERTIQQSIDLGENGMIPLEVRFHHDPNSVHGFVGAALSSTMWHWEKKAEEWAAEQVIGVEPIEVDGWPFPVPGLITDLVLSMDDRFLYFSNWLHGDLRQYDISDPSNPKMTGQVWLGGVTGKEVNVKGKKLYGGPQMLQLSLDGKRLYVTNSLYSPWDNQFYPEIGEKGSYLLQLDCNTEDGGLTLNENFMVDFGAEPGGPARAHEIRFPGGDCTSDIWV